MGLLSLLRRVADRGDDASATGPVEASALSPSSPPVDPGAAAGPEPRGPVPPAWALLPPMQPLSHAPIARSFDANVGASLRAQRPASQLLASSALSHTVDAGSVGVVDGLAVASASPVVPSLSAGADLVLRRRVLRSEELPAVDRAHPSWPVIARRVETAPVPTAAPIRRSADPDELGEAGEGAGLPAPADASPPIAGLGAVGPVDRTADTPDTSTAQGAPALPSPSAPLVHRTVATVAAPLPVASSIRRSVASGDDPVVRRVGEASVPATASMPTLPVLASRPVPTAAVGASTAPIGALARTADGPVAAAAAPSAGVDPATPSPAVVRRRNVVELGTTSSSPVDRPPAIDRTPDRVAAPDAVADSPLIERVADDAVGPATSVAGDGSADDATLQRSADAPAAAPARPTVGRRPGLGAPMTELPPTALLRSAAVDDGLLASWHLPASPLPPGESAVLGGSAGIGAAGPAPAGSAASGAGAGSLRAALVHRRADDAAVVPSLPVVGDSLAGDEPSAELTTAGPDPTLQRSGDTTAPTGSSDRALAGDRALTEAVSVGSSSGVLVGPSDVTAAAAVPAARSVLGVPAGARTSGAGALGSGSPGGLGGTSSGGGPTGQSGPGLVARQVATATGGVEVRGAAAPGSSISASGAPSGSTAQSTSSAGGFRGAPAVMLQRTVSAVASSSASGSPGRPLPSLAMVQRAPSPTSVAVAGPSASYDPLDGGTGGQGFAVQREADEPQAADAGSSGGGADPHGAEAANAAAGGASAAGGGGGGGGTPAEGAAATGSSAQAEAELEALAGRLYDRIRHRLRRELLDDRERSGLVLDRVR